MRLNLLFASGAIAAASLCACSPPHPQAGPEPHAVSTLDCPESQGDLTRKSAATDGKSCVYGDGDGDQVTLRLVSLDGGDLKTALAPIEADLKTEIPAAAAPPTPPASKTPDGAAPGHEHGDHERVDIDLPGVHIHTTGEGHADVDAAGVHVHAHDGDGREGDHADVRVGAGGSGVTVNANDGGAQIRINEGGPGLRARYILASDTPGPQGYKVAGYEARGPRGGPVVVAEILSKSDDHDVARHDIRELLRRNVGG